MNTYPISPVRQELEQLLKKRLLFIDGAMGTMIQTHKLKESDYRGTVFIDHPSDLKGNNDLLGITKPELIEQIHWDFIVAGADIIETNTFNGTTIAQADYGLESAVTQINIENAKVAKKAALRAKTELHRKVFVAGAMGPTNRTASLSPDVNDPGFRAVTYDQLKASYYEQAAALIKGGADILLPETTFDTLNVKAALHAIEDLKKDLNLDIPVMISVTITDQSGRTLSGQTVEAFWNSIKHTNPLSVGINCALGAKQMRPYIETLSKSAQCYISCYPNAGLPNPLSETGYDELPEDTAKQVSEFTQSGFVNIIGGCCGTTPAHIKAIFEKTRNEPPRQRPQLQPLTHLSGLEPLAIDGRNPQHPFIVVGERTNVSGSLKFKKLIQANDFEAALSVARSQVENGANVIDINFEDK